MNLQPKLTTFHNKNIQHSNKMVVRLNVLCFKKKKWLKYLSNYVLNSVTGKRVPLGVYLVGAADV